MTFLREEKASGIAPPKAGHRVHITIDKRESRRRSSLVHCQKDKMVLTARGQKMLERAGRGLTLVELSELESEGAHRREAQVSTDILLSSISPLARPPSCISAVSTSR